MPFSTHIPIPFGDTDPAGLVYYPNLFHYCHIAMERFFGELCGMPYHLLVKKHRIGFPTVKIESEFFEPLVYGDEVALSVSVLKVGRTSVTFNYSLQRASDNLECARATMVHVAMQLDTRQPVDLPFDLRATLESNRVQEV